jgi:hypothetical protein
LQGIILRQSCELLEGKKEFGRKKEFTALETCPERHRD